MLGQQVFLEEASVLRPAKVCEGFEQDLADGGAGPPGAPSSAVGPSSSRTSSITRCCSRRVSSKVATSSSRTAGMFTAPILPAVPCQASMAENDQALSRELNDLITC